MGPAPRWIGVDVGGSAVKLGAIAPDGTRRQESSIELLAPVPTAALVFEAVAAAIRALEPEPHRIGVGLPGLLDRRAGVIMQSPNLAWLEGFPVAGALERALDLAPGRVRLENDANAAALGELWLGAARGERHVLLLTLGTGIGGGLILDGALFVGEGLAGEVGHLSIDPRGPPCGCGSRGCLETLASASAARERARAHGLPREDPGNLELLSARAREGAGPERELLEAVGQDLGHGLSLVLSLLDVRSYLFGGGFSAALDVLEPGIRRGIREWSYGERVNAIRLARAELGASAGWIGAARLCAEAADPSG